MRAPFAIAVAVSLCLLTPRLDAQLLRDVPLRINMGGAETVDSFGRTWLGDGPGAGDPLGIRPDDAGGANWIENWTAAAFQPDSLDALGYDPNDPGNNYIFNTIRWDDGAILPDFRLEIPIPNGDYTINMFFNEGCCPQRHFKIEIQGDIVDDDVSYLDYDPVTPGLGRVGRLSFQGVRVADQLLRIGLLPCPECPGAGDVNAIIDALEVISGPDCDHLGLDFNCAYDATADRVNGGWSQLPGAEGYRLLKNGSPLGGDLPPSASSFQDPSPRANGAQVTYTLQALDGGVPTAECRCSVSPFSCPRDLTCDVNADTGEVSLSWSPGGGISLTGFEVRRDGVLLQTLPATATSYQDHPTTRQAAYQVTPLTSPPGGCLPLSCVGVCFEKNPFTVPLRINMGGRETVDSLGRVWLGDGPGSGDQLCIRPDDGGGTNFIESWCPADPQSLVDLGFDPANAGDNYIFSTIRWDVGNDGVDFYVELPVPNDTYLVNLYFNECCCTARHFQIEMQGDVVEDDVSYLDYDPQPALGKVGRLSFEGIVVNNGILRIGFLPCPNCPGAADTNAIVNAIEVLQSGTLCDDPGFRKCPGGLSCSVAADGTVSGSWNAPLCISPTGYELRRDGQLLRTLPGNATGFTDTQTTRAASYEVVPLLAAGQKACQSLKCSTLREEIPFEIPLRINMGGSATVDSRGRLWLGDGPGSGDPLSIRPDDAGGSNWVEEWCPNAALASADTLQSLGLNPNDPNDLYIFNTIRWDSGADGVDFRMELPVPNGDYQVNLYLAECCCPNRHFKVEIQDFLYDDDISSADYSQVNALGRTGRLTFEGVSVIDGILKIGLLPCPDCPDPLPVNTDAILNALEVLPGDQAQEICPHDLLCTVDGDGKVHGGWMAAEGMTVTGYQLFRNGAQVATLPAGATTFTDQPECERVTLYELAVLSDAPGFLCPGLRLHSTVVNPACPFEVPLRINMGGVETVDSHGDLWLGDGPGPGDPLEIRPDDAGGSNWIENWLPAAFKPDSLAALGFNPDHPGDRYIFNTIRWDVGATPPDYLLEIPVPNGEYTTNLYFNEECCIARHFKIEIQGDLVDDDVSYLDYNPAAPGLGVVGRLSFSGIRVTDGILRIGLLPCPDCIGAQDTNAILDALEVLPAGVAEPVFRRGDSDGSGTVDLTDAIFLLSFQFLGGPEPECLDAADADDSGTLDLTDAIYSLSWQFLGGPEPLSPGPRTCGPDPTNDNFKPCVYRACQ